MKKLLFVCSFALFSLQNVSAQNEDTWIPQQLGIGVGVGTQGITIDASTTLNRWLGVRAGVNIMPTIKVNTDLDLGTESANNSIGSLTDHVNDINKIFTDAGLPPYINLDNVLHSGKLPESMDIQGKLSNTTFHLLIDFYPFKNSSFHATTGFYIGGKELISVYNKEDGFLKPINEWNEIVSGRANLNPEVSAAVNQLLAEKEIGKEDMIGAELGDYFIAPDPADNGNVKATIEVNAFRPYLGVGFGRAVPRNGRLGCQFDLGVQFWGSPKVYAPTYDKTTGQYHKEQLTDDHAGGDGGDIIKTISKIPVYPTLSFRLVGRIL